MSTSLTELAARIAAAQASQGVMNSREIRRVIQSAYETLARLKAAEDGREFNGQSAQHADDNLAQLQANPLRSISKNQIVCLECGAEFSILSGNHLKSHGLTAKEYRKKWGLAAKHGLASKAFSQQKREKAKELGLGKGLADYRKKALKKGEIKKEQEPAQVVKRKTNTPGVKDASLSNGVQKSDFDRVLEVMRQFNDGVSVNGLARSTGFSVPNIKTILSQALEAGKVKRVSGEKLMLGYKLA